MRVLNFLLFSLRNKISDRYYLLVALLILCSSPVPAQDAAQGFYSKGKEMLDHKSYDEALKYFDYSVQANQKYVPALVSRAVVYVFLQQPENAIADCNSVIAFKTVSGKSLAAVYKTRGDAQTQNKQFKLAEQDYSQAIALDATDAEYFRSRAGVRGALKNLQGAISDYGNAIALNPARSPDDYWYRAKLYAIENQHDKALKDFDKAVEQSHGSKVHILINRAQSYLKLGMYDKAVADCSRALERLKTALNMQKETYDALKARSTAYEKMGKTVLAKHDLGLMQQLDVVPF